MVAGIRRDVRSAECAAVRAGVLARGGVVFVVDHAFGGSHAGHLLGDRIVGELGHARGIGVAVLAAQLVIVVVDEIARQVQIVLVGRIRRHRGKIPLIDQSAKGIVLSAGNAGIIGVDVLCHLTLEIHRSSGAAQGVKRGGFAGIRLASHAGQRPSVLSAKRIVQECRGAVLGVDLRELFAQFVEGVLVMRTRHCITVLGVCHRGLIHVREVSGYIIDVVGPTRVFRTCVLRRLLNLPT